MMMDILLPALLVFCSGAVFGIGTTMIVDWYYTRRWEKERETVGSENEK